MTLAERVDDPATLSEPAFVRQILGGDAVATWLLITRNNQRLFRVAWSVLRDRQEAEEAVQEAYLEAFAALPQFRGASSVSTWLIRIVLNEALGRRRATERQRKNLEACALRSLEDYKSAMARGSDPGPSPESLLMRRHVASALEGAIAALPQDVEGLNIADTAAVLGIAQPTVKTRLFRAKQKLRAALRPQIDSALETFAFAGAACQAMTKKVLARLAEQKTP